MRLDVYLTEKGYSKSRTEAKELIVLGYVTVMGKIIKKPSFDINAECEDISVDKSERKYASRGGFKIGRAHV